MKTPNNNQKIFKKLLKFHAFLSLSYFSLAILWYTFNLLGDLTTWIPLSAINLLIALVNVLNLDKIDEKEEDV